MVRPDARTAYDLAHAITTATSESSLTRAESLERVRRAWQGGRFTWEVAVQPMLCRTAEACTVLPFDHGRAEARIVQGWLPRLRLDEAQHEALMQQCGSRSCVATIEGTLASFVLSAEDATSLRFDDVRVHAVRDIGDGESWVRRKPDPKVAKLRTRGRSR